MPEGVWCVGLRIAGKVGLSKAADLLGSYELDVVGRLRSARNSEVSSASGPKRTAAELQVRVAFMTSNHLRVWRNAFGAL